MTMANPKQEAEIRDICEELDCPIFDMEWTQNAKDKWMCLIEFGTLSESLLVMGKLQGH
jgi:hypothetical protein